MSRQFRHIDRTIAEKIGRLHSEHPQLGNDGIGKLLESQGILVDPAELRAFFKHFRMHGDSIGIRPARTPAAAAGWYYGLLHPGSPLGGGAIYSGDSDPGFDSDGGDGSD